MKICDLLLEYDINQVRQLEPLLQARTQDSSIPQVKTVDDLARYLEQTMGIKNGTHVIWILRRYLKPTNGSYGINRWEDIQSRLIPALEKFTKLKNKNKIQGAQKDINQYQSLGQLEDLMDQFPDEELASQKEQASAQEQAYYDSGQAKLIYNDPQIKVVVPLTRDASCYFGVNTRWCTAAKQNNMFASYNKRGPLYIVLIKSANQRYQFHFETKQFMDEKDKDINPTVLADQYPVLWKIFTPIAEKNKSLVLNANASVDMQKAAVKKDVKAIRYIKNPSVDVLKAAFKKDGIAIAFITNPSVDVQMTAVKIDGTAIVFIENPSVDVQMAAVKKDGTAISFITDPSVDVQMAAVKKDGRAIRYIKNPSIDVQMAAVKKDGLAIEFIKNPSVDVQMAAVKQNGRAIRYIKFPSVDVKLAAQKQREKQ